MAGRKEGREEGNSQERLPLPVISATGWIAWSSRKDQASDELSPSGCQGQATLTEVRERGEEGQAKANGELGIDLHPSFELLHLQARF